MTDPSRGKAKKPWLVRVAPFLLVFVFALIAIRTWVTHEVPRSRPHGGYRAAAFEEALVVGLALFVLAAVALTIGIKKWRR